MGWNRHKYRPSIVKRHYYPDAAASFDGINTRQAHKVATSSGYIGHNNYDIAGDGLS